MARCASWAQAPDPGARTHIPLEEQAYWKKRILLQLGAGKLFSPPLSGNSAAGAKNTSTSFCPSEKRGVAARFCHLILPQQHKPRPVLMELPKQDTGSVLFRSEHHVPARGSLINNFDQDIGTHFGGMRKFLIKLKWHLICAKISNKCLIFHFFMVFYNWRQSSNSAARSADLFTSAHIAKPGDLKS